MKLIVIVIVMLGIFSCTEEFVSPNHDKSSNFQTEKIDSLDRVHYLPERYIYTPLETFDFKK